MKRILLGLGIVTVVVVGLSGAGYLIVKNALDQAGQPARGGPAPFKYDQLVEMMDAKDAPADSEIPKLIACFDRGDEDLRVIASEALARIGAPAVEPLRKMLKDKDGKVRFYCVHTLARLGPAAAPAAGDLVARLKDSDSDVRFKSAFALGQLGVHSDTVIEGLANALDDSDSDLSRTAVESLEKIGPPALPRMYRIVGDAKDPTRARLMDALEKIGSPPADALPVLVKLANDPNDLVRQPAFKLLAQLGKPAVPTFKELLKKPKPFDVMALPHAVAILSPDDAKELLPELQIFLVENRFWDAEPQLMGTLKKCGPDGAQTLTNLLITLQDPRAEIALRTLGEMGADAKVAVPTMVVLLKEHSGLQAQILDALGDIGPAARDKAAPAVEVLLAKQGNADPVLAEKARTALVRMGVFQKTPAK
jgi:HEAT repeats